MKSLKPTTKCNRLAAVSPEQTTEPVDCCLLLGRLERRLRHVRRRRRRVRRGLCGRARRVAAIEEGKMRREGTDTVTEIRRRLYGLYLFGMCRH